MKNTEPTYLEIDGFTVAGVSVRTITSDEFNPETAKLPQLWDEFFSAGIPDKIPGRLPDSPIYGVYSNYVSDVNDFYTVTAGVSINPEVKDSEFARIPISKGHYLVFEDKGAFPEVIIKTWERIWLYFSGNTEYKRVYDTDFEMCSAPGEIAIYIGVQS